MRIVTLQNLPAWAKQLALICLPASLAACAHTGTSPQAIDQILPKLENVTWCQNVPNHSLPPNNICYFILQPEVRYDEQGNRTGLHVKEKGEQYRIEFPGAQFWFDSSRQVSVPNGDAGGGITKYMNFTKRHTGLNWFALIAMIKPNHIEGPNRVLTGTDAQHLSATDSLFCPGSVGELSFYVNDTGADFFYSNNSGRALVKITRLPNLIANANSRSSEKCASAVSVPPPAPLWPN